MKVLVLGAGRMGIRHCLGVLGVKEVQELMIADINASALSTAESQLKEKTGSMKVSYHIWDDLKNIKPVIDVAIIAATAGDRINTCKEVIELGAKHILAEKPLGQSLKQVKELCDFFDAQKNVQAYVNLNMRLYSSYKKLKNDLHSFPQFQGKLTFSINTGTIGIGANGIHYIDLIKYLSGADDINVRYASIDDTLIPSGRGPSFGDFGGTAIMDFIAKEKKVLATAHFILSSSSTVLGPWEIKGPNGRIHIDEFEQIRRNKLRKADSNLPVQRYAGDYLPIQEEHFEVPFLNQLTEEWLRELINGRSILPEIKESLIVHRAMFEWLEKSTGYKSEFPIT